jgi:N-acetylneuraminic acid mutarotase
MLMADENLSAGLAVTQAEQELLGELESIIPKVGINDFSQLSVYNRENANENGNAYLLLFSAALYQHAINNTPDGSSLSGQLTGVLNILTDDFEDGVLDASSQLIDGLALAIQQLDAAEIVSNLEGRSNDVLGETLDVPDFSGFIGQFLITFPAEDATLSETTPVRLEVPSGLKNVTLDLMVDGLVIDSITEAPYEFTWDPYYWSTDSTSRHTLLVKASNAVGAEIVSNLISVSVLASSNNQLSLTSPVDSQIVENSDSVSLQWGLYEGASQYKVQVAGASSFTNILYETTTSNNQFDLTDLEIGSYYWRIQAIDDVEREGAWSESLGFILPLEINSQNINTDEDVDVSITIVANTDEEIVYTVISPPEHGVISGTFPSIMYQPDDNFFGSDSFQVRATGQGLESDIETINIEVEAVNDAPIISGEPLGLIKANEEYSYQLIVSDVDDNNLTYEALNLPDWMTLSDSGLLSGMPNNAQAGNYLDIRLSVNDGVYYVDFESFNLTVEVNPWITLADMPLANRQGAAAEYDGILYYFGGTASGSRSVYAYNSLTNTWSSKMPMPKGIYDIAAHTIGNKIYITAGYGDGGLMNDTLEYDPINDSWLTKAPRPTYRYLFSSAEVNGLIYVIGGLGIVDDGPWRSGADYNYKNYVEIYNPQTNSWSNGQHSPKVLASQESCVLDDKIYSMGGRNIIGGNTLDGGSANVQVYDANLDSWSTSVSMLSGKDALGCAVIEQKLFVFGGYNSINSDTALATVESYDTLSETWSTRHSMMSSRSRFPVIVYNGKAYVFGGYQLNGNLNSKSVEVYDPSID